MKFGLTTKDFWHPTRDLSPLFEDFDDVFDRLLVPFKSSRATDGGFSPACDVEETPSHYLMTFDLPGLAKDDVKIEVTGEQLTISGQRQSERKEDKNDHHLSERYHGSFQRTFSLPIAIEADKVEASFRDGVLRVALPKAEAAKTHQVKISEGKSGFFASLIGGKAEGKRDEDGPNGNAREVKDSNKAS